MEFDCWSRVCLRFWSAVARLPSERKRVEAQIYVAVVPKPVYGREEKRRKAYCARSRSCDARHRLAATPIVAFRYVRKGRWALSARTIYFL